MNFVTAQFNPFATEHVRGVPFRFTSGDWASSLDVLKTLRFRAAIVGRRGSGKSTALRQMVGKLNSVNRAGVYFSFSSDRKENSAMLSQALAESRQGSVLLVDGIERLSCLDRQKLLLRTKSAAGLVLAKHRRGRLPTWIHCQSTLSLMREVLADLGISEPAIVTAGDLAFDAAGGNIRDALRDLYDQYAAGKFSAFAEITDAFDGR